MISSAYCTFVRMNKIKSRLQQRGRKFTLHRIQRHRAKRCRRQLEIVKCLYHKQGGSNATLCACKCKPLGNVSLSQMPAKIHEA